MSAPLDPRLFAPGPARDPRFTVRDLRAELVNLPEGHPESRGEFLHRQMNEEVNGLEMAARNLADFPEADWELRMAMARQAWDEARHVQAFRACCERRGVAVGRYPVLNFQYRIITAIPTLIGRLAVQNRSFEAAGIDAIQQEIAASPAPGEEDLAELFDAQLADELQHVRYANVWVKRLQERLGPRATMQLAQAVAHANEALTVVAGDAILTYPVSDELRREAGFEDAEIAAAKDSAR